MKRFSQIILSFLIAFSLAAVVFAQKNAPAKKNPEGPTKEWIEKIKKAAPEKPTAAATKRKVLVFSLFTGYNHTVIPYANEVIKVLGEKSGAFTADVTTDIEALTPERLAAYDVLVLNNNCSKAPRRDLFLDELERNAKYRGMTEQERKAKTDALEKSLLDFVEGGRGLVVLHGAPSMLNNSEKFAKMIGGNFDFHPPGQKVTLHTVNPDDPLAAAFKGKEPFVHFDEPYCFGGPYKKLDFRPLLYMDVKELKNVGKLANDKTPRYVAWVKTHGKGHVFYCSPSHNPQSYENPVLLQFMLDGIQYASGDIR